MGFQVKTDNWISGEWTDSWHIICRSSSCVKWWMIVRMSKLNKARIGEAFYLKPMMLLNTFFKRRKYSFIVMFMNIHCQRQECFFMMLMNICCKKQKYFSWCFWIFVLKGWNIGSWSLWLFVSRGRNICSWCLWIFVVRGGSIQYWWALNPSRFTPSVRALCWLRMSDRVCHYIIILIFKCKSLELCAATF